MAANKPVISQFQDVIRCSVCDHEVGQLHCNTCLVYICRSCTGTHVTSDLSKQHLVVECNKRSKIKLTECKKHTSQRCDLHCKQCNVSVCSKCMASTHQQHKVIDILEFCKSVQEKIRGENKDIQESKISLLEKSKLEIEAQIQDLPSKYEEITKEITEYGETWHNRIDAIVKQLQEEVEKMKETDLNKMKYHQRQLEKLISHCQLIMENNTKLLQSVDMSSFQEYKSRIQDIKDVSPLTIDVKLPEFESVKFADKEIRTWFGSLHAGSTEIKRVASEQHSCHWVLSEKNLKKRHLKACSSCSLYDDACVVINCMSCGKRETVCSSCLKQKTNQ